MKKLIVASILLLVLLPLLNAQPQIRELAQVKEEIIKELQEEFESDPDLKNIRIMMKTPPLPKIPDPDPSTVFFGIYTEDITFPKAQALGYKALYGILITGVVPNSPAWNYRMQEDDVIMEIGGKIISNKAEFDKVRKQLRVGDKVNIKLWRAGEIVSFEMEMSGRTPPAESPAEVEKITKKKKLSTGYGGGTWIPMWVSTDMDDLNNLLKGLGFEDGVGENGMIMQGLGGKLPVGKGFFVGGYVTSYNDYGKAAADTVGNPSNIGFHNWMNYHSALLGFSLDKRIPITRGLIASLGVMVGGGNHEVEILHSNADYNWPTATTPFTTGNYNAKIGKGYMVVQPRVEFMIRLLPWLGLRAEGGYVYGYAPRKGWRVTAMDNETFFINGSPDTKFEGITVSIGPWFGF